MVRIMQQAMPGHDSRRSMYKLYQDMVRKLVTHSFGPNAMLGVNYHIMGVIFYGTLMNSLCS